MNIKQKMLEAMRIADDNTEIEATWRERRKAMLDAALSVMAYPENWTEQMREAAYNNPTNTYEADFRAIINHIKGLPT